MRLDGKTAKRYARALLDMGQPDALEGRRDALRAMSEVWWESRELRDSMANPSIPLEQKLQVIEDVATQLRPGDAQLVNFLKLLLTNRRIGGIEEISLAFSQLFDEMKKLLAVEITSARTLDGAEMQSVEQRIQSEYGSLASVDWKVDPAIIGGLLIQTGDRLLDSSVRTSLERIRGQLAA